MIEQASKKEIEKWDKILQKEGLGMERATSFGSFNLEYGRFGDFSGWGWEAMKPYDYQEPLYHVHGLGTGHAIRSAKHCSSISNGQKKRWANYDAEKRKQIGKKIVENRNSVSHAARIRMALFYKKLRKTQIFPPALFCKADTVQRFPLYTFLAICSRCST